VSDNTNHKMPSPGEFCWNELMTPNVLQAKEFYGALFGWQSEDVAVGDMTYTIFKQGDKGIGGMMQIPQDQKAHISPHWMSYVSVEDVDAMVAKAKNLGAKILVPATTVNDMGRFAVIQDTGGANVAVWQSLKACD